MSPHQKQVTIAAVDNWLLSVGYDGEGARPTAAEIDEIHKSVEAYLKAIPAVVKLRKGQTLTVEQLPKQPAPEAQKETDAQS